MDKIMKYYELCSVKAADQVYSPLYSFLNIEGRRKLFSEAQEAELFVKRRVENEKELYKLEVKKGGQSEGVLVFI